MAGHSKFKNIMYRKGAQDKKRSAMFSKLSREITVAARSGSPDPDMNPRLRAAVLAARAQSMPKDNIERAIKKAQGGDADTYESIRYEGYAPGGIAVIVEALTDNRNRTGGAIRAIFTKYAGNLGATGSVSHLFQRVGEITYKADVATADAMLEAAIEAGAEDAASDESGHLVTCGFEDMGSVSHALEAKFGQADQVKSIWKPNMTTQVDEERAAAILKMIAALEDDDDVQAVFANFEVDEATMAKLTAA